MKEHKIIYQVFERGDYIRTRYGVSIVLENEEIKDNVHDIYHNDIYLQYKNNYEDNIANKPTWEKKHGCYLISKDEYEKEPIYIFKHYYLENELRDKGDF
jgi:hypothetical protein